MAFFSKLDFEKFVNQIIPSKWRGDNVQAFFKLFAQDTNANTVPDYEALALLENQKQSNGTPFEIQEALRELTGDELLTITESPGIPGFVDPQGVAEYGEFIYITKQTPAEVRVIRKSSRTLAGSFGEFGSGDGQLNNPQGIAVDENRIYVAELGNSRVSVFDRTTFSFIGKFGTNGSGDGQFNGLRDVAVDDSFIYTIESNGDRIQKFDKSTFAFDSKFGTGGAGNGQFNNARGIDIDGSFIYIADRGNDRVQVIDLSPMAYDSQFGTNGSGNGQFDGLSGIAVNGSQIYTTETINHRVQLFNKTTKAYVNQFGSLGSGDDEFNSPPALDIDASYIYVVDGPANDRVKVHDISSPFGFVGQVEDTPYSVEVSTNDLTNDQPIIDDFLNDTLLAGIGYSFVERQLFVVDGVAVPDTDMDLNTGGEWSEPFTDQTEIVSATNTNRKRGFTDSAAKISTATNYNTRYKIKSISGSVRLGVGAGLGTIRSAPGIYEEVIASGASRELVIRNHTIGASAVIENIEVWV